MDLLSSALLSLKVPPIVVVDCRFGGDWGFVCDDLVLPYAVVLLEGECWTSIGAQSPVRLRAGDDAQLISRIQPLDARFARVVSAMQSRPAETWRLETLAALAGMSRSAFARAFPRVFGCPPMRYLADLRG